MQIKYQYAAQGGRPSVLHKYVYNKYICVYMCVHMCLCVRSTGCSRKATKLINVCNKFVASRGSQHVASFKVKL